MKTEHLERERQLEFINKMVANGYELFEPKSYEDIKRNFKSKLEKINDFKLSNNEFEQFYNKINQGTVFQRSCRLLREIDIQLDNGDTKVLKLIKKDKWCENQFQIAEEIWTENKDARFDSIIFINGLPLVIMEFKQSRVGLKQGIEQIISYQKRGKFHDLFLYCQIFIASSFANTRYFANNNKINRDFIFKWTDENNNEIGNLIDGVQTIYESLLSRCFIAEMIVRYMIQKESDKVNIILRPYQVYATKKILEKVKYNSGNGYIFHTTGSGKTITSFKTCRLLSQDKKVDKVIFLVDRKDLDAQTKSSYESFESGSYEGANNSAQLKKLLFNNGNEIIVATVQKITRLIQSLSIEEKEVLKKKRAVIIIDECHRSQSDRTVNCLREVFVSHKNAQYFGFTGTPISNENAKSGLTNYKTTVSVFDEELHKYSITDAVRDKNVLQFNISQPKAIAELDQDYLNEKRIIQISKYIIDSFDNYNDNRRFNGILASKSKEQLKLYYHALKEYNQQVAENQKIKFTCIFSTNPEDQEEYVENGSDDEFVKQVITDFNQTFNGNEQVNNIEGFKHKVYDYVRKKELDLVIVVNMLLTGFDSPLTKTLYVDKPLKYHGLLQAYSRVNRLAENKLFGNVVTFVEQKKDRDDALRLFSAGGTYTDFEIRAYSELLSTFNQQLIITKNACQDGDELRRQLHKGDLSEIETSLQAIKELQKQYSFIKINPDFNDEDLNISKKELNDLKDVYREVYNALIGRDELSSEAENNDNTNIQQLEFDFDINLFDEDRINLEYLLKLTQQKVDEDDKAGAIELIEQSDLSKEIRDGVIESIDDYSQNKDRNLIAYLKNVMTRHKEQKYDEYSEKQKVEDVEKFKAIITEQEQGNLKPSQANKYDAIKTIKGLKKKRLFRRKTYEFVEDVVEKYDIDKKLSN